MNPYTTTKSTVLPVMLLDEMPCTMQYHDYLKRTVNTND